jgi:hypothetical protein
LSIDALSENYFVLLRKLTKHLCRDATNNFALLNFITNKKTLTLRN